MANKNRKNQNNVSADHKMTNEKKDNTAKESSKCGSVVTNLA